mmetsp:Transcript_3248/g.8222  ORF Transcript_3248/g.8222 Transcript_3248/m.8222 type:complete len:282 (-) Transcript_3248:536-1381(-)
MRAAQGRRLDARHVCRPLPPRGAGCGTDGIHVGVGLRARRRCLRAGGGVLARAQGVPRRGGPCQPGAGRGGVHRAGRAAGARRGGLPAAQRAAPAQRLRAAAHAAVVHPPAKGVPVQARDAALPPSLRLQRAQGRRRHAGRRGAGGRRQRRQAPAAARDPGAAHGPPAAARGQRLAAGGVHRRPGLRAPGQRPRRAAILGCGWHGVPALRRLRLLPLHAGPLRRRRLGLRVPLTADHHVLVPPAALHRQAGAVPPGDPADAGGHGRQARQVCGLARVDRRH